jgi:hypothetical protein
MSNGSNQANISATGFSTADTSSDETKSRRDFLPASAGLIGAAAAVPTFSARGR